VDRVAVITDIHGNLPALETALQRTCELDVDAVYCGDDLLGGQRVPLVHGSPRKVNEYLLLPVEYGEKLVLAA
jgi:predicted phosphodiesterase